MTTDSITTQTPYGSFYAAMLARDRLANSSVEYPEGLVLPVNNPKLSCTLHRQLADSGKPFIHRYTIIEVNRISRAGEWRIIDFDIRSIAPVIDYDLSRFPTLKSQHTATRRMCTRLIDQFPSSELIDTIQSVSPN